VVDHIKHNPFKKAEDFLSSCNSIYEL